MKRFLSFMLTQWRVLKPPSISMVLMLIILNNSVIVQWQANTEPDLAGYKVYYGKTSHAYTRFISAGLATECTITDLQPGNKYFFAVTAYDTAGNESPYSEEVSIVIAGNENVITSTDKNVYNFPNPFNPEQKPTQIRYHLPEPEDVTIQIYDMSGNKVRTILDHAPRLAGEHTADAWDGRDDKGKLVPNGIYYANVVSQTLAHYITIAVTR